MAQAITFRAFGAGTRSLIETLKGRAKVNHRYAAKNEED
jgi:hypothetical protein